MAYVKGNHKLQNLRFVYDERGNVEDVMVRVNRDMVDNEVVLADGTFNVVRGVNIGTSDEVSVLASFPTTQQDSLKAIGKRIPAILAGLDYGD